jgi:uncharacterized protein (TIGR02284 family)
MAEIIQILNDLVAACRDSEAGFGRAGKSVRNENLRERLTSIARQRGELADELIRNVRKLGGACPDSGYPSDLSERAWDGLGNSIDSKDDDNILMECLAAEEHTLGRYERALIYDLPPHLRPVVDRQRLTVQEALLELRSLEPLRKAG